MRRARVHVSAGMAGLLLGFALSRMGFTDWGQVHRMFTFTDPRLVLTFLGSVALAMVAFGAVARGRPAPRKPLHPGSLLGGALFGVGWALTGACPSVPLVQLGEGRLAALVPLAGIAAGMLGHRFVHGRWLRWPTDQCG